MIAYGMTTRYRQPIEVTSVATFFEGVLNTLRYWRDVHTHAETWVRQYDWDDGGDCDVNSIKLSNQWFSVSTDSLKLELAKIAVNDGEFSSYYCPECGYEGEESECPDCDGEVECFSNDPESLVDCMDFSAVKWCNFKQVLEEYAFPLYSDALEYVICGVLEEVEEYIEKLETAETPYDKLAAMIQALGLAHTNGQIFSDYLDYGMGDMEWSDILNIRENGLIAEFTPEDVKEFLDS